MKKILIISSNRLGDAILSSGLVDYFKEKQNPAEITFVCGELPFQLFSKSENIDHIIKLKKQKKSLHWLKLWSKIVLSLWDHVIDLRGTAISFFLITKKRSIRPFIQGEKKTHKVLAISNFFKEQIIKPSLKIKPLSAESLKKLEVFKNSNKKVLTFFIAPGANWAGKKWPKENFKELIKKLGKRFSPLKYRFVIIGSESEKFEGNYIKSFFKDNVIDLTGSLTLHEIFFFLKYCKLFIGNDSGLMHLSAATGAPTVGLFGPSDIDQYHPWGENTLAIRTPENPHQLMGDANFSPKNKKSLMESLKVDKVERDVVNFLNNLNKK